MKNGLIIFLVGAIAGGIALHLYQTRESQPQYSGTPAATTAASRAQDTAATARDSLDQKLREWKLTPDDIKQDLAKTGQVVRTKSEEVGSRLDDARVVAVVKAKYVLDSDLSALSINVDCHDGEVSLSGTVKSPALIGRAIGLALETHGVHDVVSRLTVAS